MFGLKFGKDRGSQAKYGAPALPPLRWIERIPEPAPIPAPPATGPIIVLMCPHPECRAREFVVSHDAWAASLVGGEIVEVAVGKAVVCLKCHRPYVLSALEPGGTFVATPPMRGNGTPPAKPNAQQLATMLAQLAGQGPMEEP